MSGILELMLHYPWILPLAVAVVIGAYVLISHILPGWRRENAIRRAEQLLAHSRDDPAIVQKLQAIPADAVMLAISQHFDRLHGELGQLRSRLEQESWLTRSQADELRDRMENIRDELTWVSRLTARLQHK